MNRNTTKQESALKRIARWFRRISLVLLATLIILMTGGFALERLAQASDARDYPAPGQMIDVGGHQLHFYVTGEITDQPTVILEAGNGGFSSQWVWIQDELSTQTRVVSYDRAGLGWSESDAQPRDLFRNVEQLRTGLRRLDIEPPYILVGHSLGGVFNLAYAKQYPDEVAGLVFLDSSHPDQINRLPPELVEAQQSAKVIGDMMSTLAHFGVIRLIQPNAPFVAALPERQKAETLAISSTARYQSATYGEMVVFDEAPEQLRDLTEFRDIPVIVLTAGMQLSNPDLPPSFGEVLLEQHAELASLSVYGQHRIVEGADHFSIVMEQAYALKAVDAIREAMSAVRSS
jgi:pimeloyl-ACP methyl ester carboxylesterase